MAIKNTKYHQDIKVCFFCSFFSWKRSIKQQRKKNRSGYCLMIRHGRLHINIQKIVIKVYEVIASIRLGTNLELQMVKGE